MYGHNARFGYAEREQNIGLILKFLADDTRSVKFEAYRDFGDSLGWEKKFEIDTIKDISPDAFATLCAAGLIKSHDFPKGSFKLAAKAINGIKEAPYKGY